MAGIEIPFTIACRGKVPRIWSIDRYIMNNSTNKNIWDYIGNYYINNISNKRLTVNCQQDFRLQIFSL